jgi:transposase
MSTNKFTDEFKRDAVAQVEDRGHPVREVAERLGVSTKSIYTWHKQFLRPAKVIQEVDAQADEIRRLKPGSAAGHGGTGHPKKATAYFATESPLSRFAGKPLPGSG